MRVYSQFSIEKGEKLIKWNWTYSPNNNLGREMGVFWERGWSIWNHNWRDIFLEYRVITWWASFINTKVRKKDCIQGYSSCAYTTRDILHEKHGHAIYLTEIFREASKWRMSPQNTDDLLQRLNSWAKRLISD